MTPLFIIPVFQHILIDAWRQAYDSAASFIFTYDLNGKHNPSQQVFMTHANDNQPPEWALISELHFFCDDFSLLINTISALPAEQKHRFAGVIKSMTDRLCVIHNLVEAQNDNMVNQAGICRDTMRLWLVYDGLRIKAVSVLHTA